MTYLIWVLAAVGLVPGARAALLDFKAGQAAWGVLDIFGALAAGLGLFALGAVAELVPH